MDPMSLPLTNQNQLEQVPLRFCASHGTKVVVWPHMPHVVTLTAVPAALAHIMLSTAQGQSQPSPQSSPAAARDPHSVPPASLGEHELSFFLSLTFTVCCYLVLSIFNDIARINSSFMICYCMILFCFLFLVPLPPVSEITPLRWISLPGNCEIIQIGSFVTLYWTDCATVSSSLFSLRFH